MDTPRFNDAVLNHIIGTLNGRIGGILQEQQTQAQNMHAEFNQWASQQQEQEQQLRALLAESEERANTLQRRYDWVLGTLNQCMTEPEVDEVLARFQAAEQRKQDDITAAIAPVRSVYPVASDARCVNCDAGIYSDNYPTEPDGTCLNCGHSFTVTLREERMAAQKRLAATQSATGSVDATAEPEPEPEPVPEAEPVRVDPVDQEEPTPPRPRRGLPKH